MRAITTVQYFARLMKMFEFNSRYQEGVHSTWLGNAVLAFQAALLDALTADKRTSHSPLVRAGAANATVSQYSLLAL